MNVKQIEYILAVAELHSFGQAAEKCSVTQSTLSTMVAKFEDEIGFSIFDRKTKPISITKEGAVIIEKLTHISSEFDQLTELVKSLKGELKGELTIGVIPTISPYLIPEFINDFTQQFPDIQCVIREIRTHVIMDMLLDRQLDVGILALPLRHEMLVEMPIYNESFVMYDCTKEGLNETIEPADINDDKFWLLEDGHCMQTQVKYICDISKSVSGVDRYDYKAGTIDSLIRMVRINEGMTLLPYLATLDLPNKERGKIKKFRGQVPARTVGLVVHKHFVKGHLAQKMAKEISKKILPLLDMQKDIQVIDPI